jgi:hypothetical protein
MASITVVEFQAVVVPAVVSRLMSIVGLPRVERVKHLEALAADLDAQLPSSLAFWGYAPDDHYQGRTVWYYLAPVVSAMRLSMQALLAPEVAEGASADIKDAFFAWAAVQANRAALSTEGVAAAGAGTASSSTESTFDKVAYAKALVGLAVLAQVWPEGVVAPLPNANPLQTFTFAMVQFAAEFLLIPVLSKEDRKLSPVRDVVSQTVQCGAVLSAITIAVNNTLQPNAPPLERLSWEELQHEVELVPALGPDGPVQYELAKEPSNILQVLVINVVEFVYQRNQSGKFVDIVLLGNCLDVCVKALVANKQPLPMRTGKVLAENLIAAWDLAKTPHNNVDPDVALSALIAFVDILEVANLSGYMYTADSELGKLAEVVQDHYKRTEKLAGLTDDGRSIVDMYRERVANLSRVPIIEPAKPSMGGAIVRAMWI